MKPLIFCLLFVVSLHDVLGYSSTFYTDNDLGQTIPIGIGKRQKKEIQQGILELMGLYSKPKRLAKESNVQSASEFMQKLYNTLTDGDAMKNEDDSHFHIRDSMNASALGLDPSKVDGCDVIVSFVNKAKKVPHLRHEKDRTFYFDFSEVSVGEQVKGAELRIFKEKVQEKTDNSEENKYPGLVTIALYRIKQGKDWEDKVLQEESKTTLSLDAEGWLVLEATQAAEEWTFFPYSNMGLYMKITDAYGNELEPRDIGLVDRRGAASKLPFLVAYMKVSEELLSRRTRAAHSKAFSQTSVSHNTNPYAVYSRHKRSYPPYVSTDDCQRHHLYINFTELGLHKDYLISPEGYTAYYCAGQCSFPMGIHANATNHAIVQTLVHLMKPTHVPNPCCAPKKFGYITILFREDNTVYLKHLRGMKVLSCGCH